MGPSVWDPGCGISWLLNVWCHSFTSFIWRLAWDGRNCCFSTGSLFPWPAWAYSVLISRWDVFLCGWFSSEWGFHEVQVEAERPSQSNLISPSMSLLHILLVTEVRISNPDSRRWKNRLGLSMGTPWHEGSRRVMPATLETSYHTWGGWEHTFFWSIVDSQYSRCLYKIQWIGRIDTKLRDSVWVRVTSLGICFYIYYFFRFFSIIGCYTEYSSLCYTVGLCFSILYTVVCIC